MENQHRKISNYRELNQKEIDLMNEIKEQGSQLKSLFEKIEKYHEDVHEEQNLSTGDWLDSCRSGNIAKEQIQTGLMWLTRSVARPQNFG